MRDNGDIVWANDEEAAKREGLYPLTEQQARGLGGMNRHDRRAWLAQQRKADRVRAKMGAKRGQAA